MVGAREPIPLRTIARAKAHGSAPVVKLTGALAALAKNPGREAGRELFIRRIRLRADAPPRRSSGVANDPRNPEAAWPSGAGARPDVTGAAGTPPNSAALIGMQPANRHSSVTGKKGKSSCPSNPI